MKTKFSELPEPLKSRYEGDWRHPGVYCLRHLPTGLEYVGASANVKTRLEQHQRNPDWKIYLKRQLLRVGPKSNVDNSDILPLFLERVDPWRLQEREDHHLNARKPVLNCCGSSGYGRYGSAQNLPKVMEDPLLLGPPPGCPNPCEIKGLLQLREILAVVNSNADQAKRAKECLLLRRKRLAHALVTEAIVEAEAAAAVIYEGKVESVPAEVRELVPGSFLEARSERLMWETWQRLLPKEFRDTLCCAGGLSHG